MMGILNKLKNMFKRKKKTEVVTPLDPNQIRKDRQVKSMTKEIQSLKAQISKLMAEKREEHERDREEDEQEVLRQKLQEEDKEIQENKFGKSASLKKILSMRNLNKIEICDKDDKEVFGKFGDMLILDSGRIALTDSGGNVLSYGKDISHVIYKPGSLLNQIRRGRILIPCDKNLEPAIDWEDVDVDEIQYDAEEKRYKLTQEAKETARKMIIEKDKEHRKLVNDFDRLENTYIDLKKEYDDLKRAHSLVKGDYEAKNSELSKVMNQFSVYQNTYGDVQRQMAQLTEMKSLYEQMIVTKDNTIKELLNKVEQTGDRTVYEKSQEMLKENLDYVASLKERVGEIPIEVKNTQNKGENQEKK